MVNERGQDVKGETSAGTAHTLTTPMFFAVLILNTLLAAATLGAQVSIQWWLVFALWLNALIYTSLRLRHRVFASLFLVSYFVFLLSRPFLQLYLGYELSQIPVEAMSFLQRVFMLSLLSLGIGYAFGSNGLRSDTRSDLQSIPKNGVTDSGVRSRVQRTSLVLFWALIPGAAYWYLSQALFVQRHSYTTLYTEEYVSASSSLFQTIASYMGAGALVALTVFLAALPPLSKVRLPMVAWVVLMTPLLVAGRRRDFLLAIALFGGYLVMRGIGMDLASRLRMRYVIIGAVAVPAVVAALSLVETSRGLGGETNGPGGFITNFLYGQGVTVNTLTATFSYGDLIPRQFYLAEFARSGFIPRILGIPVFQGNSVERALEGGSLSHSLSMLVLGDRYLSGVSTGTSFIAEGYMTWSYCGVVFVSVLFGLLIAEVCRFGHGGLVADTLRLLIVPSLIWAPRGSSTGFISALITPSTVFVLGVVAIWTALLLRRSSLGGDTRPQRTVLSSSSRGETA